MTENISLESLEEGHYSFPGPLRDKLVAAILSGEKTGTSSLVQQYEMDGDPLPAVGDREAILDSDGNRVCATENTEVTVVPFGDITLQQALDEGEGFESISDWQTAHRQFWESEQFRASMGEDYRGITADTPVVYVRFKVIARA